MGLQWFFRDVWLLTLGVGQSLLAVPKLARPVLALSGRMTAPDAFQNLRLLSRAEQLLESNLQEALILEVAFLRLKM
jgi:hypothetical protein